MADAADIELGTKWQGVTPALSRAARGTLNLRALDVADAAGLARSTFATWEGRGYRLGQADLKAIAEVYAYLGVTWDEYPEVLALTVAFDPVALAQAEDPDKPLLAKLAQFRRSDAPNETAAALAPMVLPKARKPRGG